MNFVRQAVRGDISRIAEIIITNYRMNFYPFFRNDEYYFRELNVIEMAKEYYDDEILKNTFVCDDGVVKGIIRINHDEVEKLFVEPQFQSMGIGGKLLEFAVSKFNVIFLWVLEYNRRGIEFYRKHGFELTGEKITEDECVPLLKMKRTVYLKKIPSDSDEKFIIEKINRESFPQNESIH